MATKRRLIIHLLILTAIGADNRDSGSASRIYSRPFRLTATAGYIESTEVGLHRLLESSESTVLATVFAIDLQFLAGISSNQPHR